MSRLMHNYTKPFVHKIFEVGGRSLKNAKILHLENLALYGMSPHCRDHLDLLERSNQLILELKHLDSTPAQW